MEQESASFNYMFREDSFPWKPFILEVVVSRLKKREKIKRPVNIYESRKESINSIEIGMFENICLRCL